MKYAKLINGVLYPVIPVFVPNEKFIFKPTEKQLLAAGYLPVQYTEAPKAQNGQKPSYKWVEKDGAIVQEWIAPKQKPNKYAIARSMVIQTADDNTALRMRSYYPEWAAGVDYPVGHKVQRNGKLWRVVQAHTAQVGWEPEVAASLWEQINETYDGTIDDAIPYSGNMALAEGLYYTQDGVVYKCTRDTVNPVYAALRELVGLYVEEVITA